MSDPLDWPFKFWFRLAVLQMSLTPETFWNMDVIDWLTLCKKDEGEAMSPADFDALIKQFPDGKVPHDGDR